jgi:hypothetical protein
MVSALACGQVLRHTGVTILSTDIASASRHGLASRLFVAIGLRFAPSCPQAVPHQSAEALSLLTSLLSKRSALGESS